jgi:hypothetical protein
MEATAKMHSRNNFSGRMAAVAGAVMLFSASAHAQTADDGQFDGELDRELLELAESIDVAFGGARAAVDQRRRAMIAGVPSGYGLSGGTLALSFSGAYHQSPRGTTDTTHWDASTSLSLGFGDPETAIGFDFALVNTSFRNFGRSGFLTAGVSKSFQLEGGSGSIALNVSNIAGWGDSRNNRLAATVVGSYSTHVGDMPTMLTLGAGNRLSRSGGLGAILGYGVGFAPDWSASIGVVGQSPVIGANYFPPELNGASVGVSLRDFDRRKQAVFGVDIGYSFNMFER